MTFNARNVLDDCRLVLSMLEEEDDFDKWRIHWLAALAAIRAVGHVLSKVDGDHDSSVKINADRLFKEWKSDITEHQIFREFIEQDRNLILKEYNSRLFPNSKVPLATEITTNAPEGHPAHKIGQVFEVDHRIYRPFSEGPYEGIDARDVYQEAIEWWKTQLSRIDEMSE